MTKQAQKNSDNSRNAKKARVLSQSNKPNRTPMMIAAVVAIAAIAGGVFLLGGTGSDVGTAVATGTLAADQVTHPVALFDDGKARHFKYTHGDITIRYFVLKSSDGIVRAAFDACDVCWPANKGYYQEGDVMVCRNCGRRFASIKVNEVKGGCNPAPLERSVSQDQLVIKTTDLITGTRFFNFKKGDA